jgi:hypothetical protein
MWTPGKPSTNYVRKRERSPRGQNIIEASRDHDEEWEPQATEDFYPTDAPSGSAEKVEVLRKRVELGQPLWHEADRVDYSGLKSRVRAFPTPARKET